MAISRKNIWKIEGPDNLKTVTPHSPMPTDIDKWLIGENPPIDPPDCFTEKEAVALFEAIVRCREEHEIQDLIKPEATRWCVIPAGTTGQVTGYGVWMTDPDECFFINITWWLNQDPEKLDEGGCQSMYNKSQYQANCTEA